MWYILSLLNLQNNIIILQCRIYKKNPNLIESFHEKARMYTYTIKYDCINETKHTPILYFYAHTQNVLVHIIIIITWTLT